MKEHIHIPFSKIFTNALFVTGMTIGAGILGLPIKTGAAGVIPSLISMLVIWVFMMATAAIFVYKFTHPKERSRSYPVLFQNELGTTGRVLGTFGYLINFYGLMVAYLTGAAAILMSLSRFNLPVNVWMTAFFIVATLITLTGAEKVGRLNVLIMAVLALLFGAMIFKTVPHVDVSRFARSDWAFTTSIFPIIVVAFCFQNVIPFVCKNLDGDARASFKAITLGSLIAIIINVVWMLTVIGSLPLEGPPDSPTILGALAANQPATIPLAEVMHSKVVTITGMFFAILAITTSYVPTGLALTGFIRGRLSMRFKNVKNYVVVLLSFGPPFLVAMLFPNIFLKAMDVVGGVGIVTIFGILPSLILAKMALRLRKRLLLAVAIVILTVSSLLLIFEVAQETGLLKLNPTVETWKPLLHEG